MNWLTDGPSPYNNQEWVAESEETNDYHLITKYPDGFHLSAVKRLGRLRTLEEAQAFAEMDVTGSKPEALEKFRDAIGGWLVNTMNEICPMCGREPSAHADDCWVQLTLLAWDELHGL
jgi:hypothetical protein